MMVDVSKYVPVPFTGTGEPQTLLQEFWNWKGKWSLAERKLWDSPHVTDEVLQSQLLNALSGEARNTVSALPAGSFDKTMDLLTAKFGEFPACSLLHTSVCVPTGSTSTGACTHGDRRKL